MSKPRRTHILVQCPCGSGAPPEVCHQDIDGRLRKTLQSLRPSGPITGHANPNCYLRGTADCSDKLSREHYISEAVLSQLGETLDVSGMPWMQPGQTLQTTAASLTAKILCDRHNSALSPLDAEAGLFFSAIRKALLDLKRRSLSRKPTFYLISGDALELWILKVACGLYFSVGSQGGVKVSATHAIDMAKVHRAFFDSEWDDYGGLYFKGTAGSVVTTGHHAQFSPLIFQQGMLVTGARASLLRYELELVFDTSGANPGPWTSMTRRPSELAIEKGRRQHLILLTWPPGTPQMTVITTWRQWKVR